MEEQDPKAEKKRKQHEAWKRWYYSEKGTAYRIAYKQKAKERRALAASK